MTRMRSGQLRLGPPQPSGGRLTDPADYAAVSGLRRSSGDPGSLMVWACEALQITQPNRFSRPRMVDN